PFRQLFSHCAAVVHHGGIGTTARALAAGKPQLVFPMGYDQFDNADRLRRLGVGRWIPTKRRSVRHIADALTALLTDSVATRCQAIAARFPPNDPLTAAAELLEELAGTHMPQSKLA